MDDNLKPLSPDPGAPAARLIEDRESARRRVEALGRATATLRNALLRLAAPQSLIAFLEIMAIETLAATGTTFGAIVLIEESGSDTRSVNPVVVVEDGVIASAVAAEAMGLGRALIQGDFAEYMEMLESSESGLYTSPQVGFFNAALRERLEQNGIVWIQNMPLRVRGRMIGYIGAGYRQRLINDLERIAMLKMLADMVAVSVVSFQVGKRAEELAASRELAIAAQRRVDELAAANRALTRSIELLAIGGGIDDMLAHVLGAIAGQIQDSVVSVLWLVDADNQIQYPRLTLIDGEVASGSARANPSTRSGPIERTLFGDAPGHHPHVVDATDLPEGLQELMLRRGVYSTIVLPMFDLAGPVGAVVIGCRAGPEPIDLNLQIAWTLAQQAILAVRLERAAQRAEDESREAATMAERARAARELHDTLAQGLTGTLMHIHAFQRSSDWTEAQHHLREAMQVSESTLVESRRSMRALRSQTRERDSVAALGKMIDDTLDGSGIIGRINVTGLVKQVAKRNQHDLLKIVQEAATNAIKHSRASSFNVHLDFGDDALLVKVRDDGIGLRTGAVTGGFGLIGMRERVARLGGQLEVESPFAQGLSLSFSIPHVGSSSL